jgi:hypothetical protein
MTVVQAGISSRREAPSHAVGLRSGTAHGSCCGRSHRGGRAALGQRRGGMARSEENQRGGARAVAGLGTTRGCYPSRKWHRQSCSDGELRWQAVSGGSGGDAARSGKASRDKLRRWASSGATRGAVLEQERTSGGAARGPAAALSRSREGGRGGRRGGGARG